MFRFSPKTRIAICISLFLVGVVYYNYNIYSSDPITDLPVLSNEAIAGQRLWQENNCTSCHQLYGLGGYLGPDLTNIISHPKKGADYFKVMLNSGIMSMPKFDFNKEEQEQLTAYLEHIDNTGIYPNREANTQISGWVKLEYKNVKHEN